MAGVVWTKKENNILKKYWKNSKKEDILNRLGSRTWNACVIQAVKLHLNRDKTHINVNGTKKRNYINGVSKLCSLLKEIPEAYYWAGFIAADGHITSKYRLKITLSLKDLKHLQKFAKFVNCNIVHINKYKNYCWISLQDKNIIKKFENKFKICSYKTYNLIDPKIKSKKLFFSFLAGFIDGDGRVARLWKRQDAHISIVGHKNSLKVFRKWFKRLFLEFKPIQSNSLISKGTIPYIDKEGYARGVISNFEIVKLIKKIILKLNLPAMKRKWNTVDLNKVSRYTESRLRKEKALKLKDKGFNRTKIANKLGVTISSTYRYF